MAKLVKFMDGKFGCWSRVDLDNGEPIWISIAQTGIIVKKSKWRLFGADLYNESNVYKAGRTAQILDGEIKKYTTPQNMMNLVLRSFTQAALDSDSAAQLSIRLNRALEAVDEQINLYEKTSFRQVYEKIINKQDVEYIFSLEKKGWENYVNKIAYPIGWKVRIEYYSLMAFDPMTNIGLSIQPLFKDDNSPPTALVVGSHYSLGTLPAFTDDVKNRIEKEATDDLGPQYSVSVSYYQTPPLEGIELHIVRK